jgi:hypothetical protein
MKTRERERDKMETRRKRTGPYKNCGNYLPAFYTLLDTNLPRIVGKNKRKRERK